MERREHHPKKTMTRGINFRQGRHCLIEYKVDLFWNAFKIETNLPENSLDRELFYFSCVMESLNLQEIPDIKRPL
jgi:hypothetical protein